MSIRSMFVAFAALVVATPAVLCAQFDDAEADFVKARQQFIAGQGRLAAQTLQAASAHVRQQVGRCRDADVGTHLMDAESQLDKLAAAMRAGTVGGVKKLDQTLMQIDRWLAEHHLLLAASNLVKPRAQDIPIVAGDIDHAVFHYERSITLDGHELAGEQVTAVADARALAKEIEDTKAIPKGAAMVLETLQRLAAAPVTVAASP